MAHVSLVAVPVHLPDAAELGVGLGVAAEVGHELEDLLRLGSHDDRLLGFEHGAPPTGGFII
jgi:hypothetical protein